MLLEQNVVKNVFVKCTCASQAVARESIARCHGYLERARKDEPGKDKMTVLFDKRIHELLKCIPLTSLGILIVGVLCRRKLILKMSHLLGKAETGLGESNIPFNALIMGKRTKVKLGHYIERFSERNLKITRDNALSGGERRGNKVNKIGTEFIFTVARGNRGNGRVRIEIVHADTTMFGNNCGLVDGRRRLLRLSNRRMANAVVGWFGGRFLGRGHAENMKTKKSGKKNISIR
jgi:hypothetical protein